MSDISDTERQNVRGLFLGPSLRRLWLGFVSSVSPIVAVLDDVAMLPPPAQISSRTRDGFLTEASMNAYTPSKYVPWS